MGVHTHTTPHNTPHTPYIPHILFREKKQKVISYLFLLLHWIALGLSFSVMPTSSDICEFFFYFRSSIYTVIPLQMAALPCVSTNLPCHSVQYFETSISHSVVMSTLGTEWRTH